MLEVTDESVVMMKDDVSEKSDEGAISDIMFKGSKKLGAMNTTYIVGGCGFNGT
jgi:hypothetical protein